MLYNNGNLDIDIYNNNEIDKEIDIAYIIIALFSETIFFL